MAEVNVSQLESRMDAASVAIRRQPTMAQGASKSEAAYGVAYQQLVQAGLRRQLRKKYRSK